MTRIYLDNAATSWPKPESVYVAINDAQRYLGASIGRGAYRQANDVTRLIEGTRGAIAQLIHAESDRNIAFMFSCTDALCTAIFGILESDDHVVTSTAEHNSVLRPLQHLEQQNKISVTRVPCDCAGRISSAEIIAAIQPDTRLVVISHANNVTGAIQPIAKIGKWCRQHNVPFLVDAAQSIGHLSIDVRELNCDMLAAAGHKGLLGPLGTGFLYYSDKIADRLTPFRFGGTGSTINSDAQPHEWPIKFEAGNLNVPGLIGLGAGIQFLTGCEGTERWEMASSLKEKLLDGLQQINGITLHGPSQPGERLGVFSVSVDGTDCHDAAAILDSSWSIQTRAGFHCAPLLHRTIGRDAAGGTLRMSLGLFNTADEVAKTLGALAEMIAK